MFDRLDSLMSFHQQALGLRAERQQVLATNIANADTPGYLARDIDFSATLAKATVGNAAPGPLALNTTQAGHQAASGAGLSLGADLLYRVPTQPSLDGNTVDMDVERVNFADNSLHYEASLELLTGKIQGLRLAMQSENS
ncbi:flagellar basal body rod protein FlgB [Cobetia amphilecti]|uniref:flagellar basal body rod protein FlgB n=1 Tax=Cobetia amphilecti TaxID=1055104 RepID=UPI001C08C6EB|nr:flagellar basal body rod protein FlgB [Cobetia amphilecti]MBU3008272.1 flagellar basal body rod protein FlgB [Cobetia amphilecti]